MVESRIYPFARFSACIEKLDEAMIEVLKDSMLRMECPLPMLKNNYQTCIFYALDALFQTYGIYTEPVITRNTTYRREEELNAFFDYFLTSTASYPCRYKEIKNVTFPDNCILAFYNGYNHIIHAVFYRNGLFYTKNGLFSSAGACFFLKNENIPTSRLFLLNIVHWFQLRSYTSQMISSLYVSACLFHCHLYQHR